MKKKLAACLASVILLTAALPALAADGHLVQKTIVALGIMQGDGKGNLNLSGMVTRAEFAKMMVAASVHRDAVGQGSALSPFKDVKHTHWAADHIKTAVDAQWLAGYVDGTFRPDSTILLEEAASAILKMLGYTAADLSGTYPNAQMVKCQALKLDVGVSAVQGQKLTRRECMHIFYNLMGGVMKSGAVYGTSLGYPMDASGGIDYDAIVRADMKGPFVLTGEGLAAIVPFEPAEATVYKNSNASAWEAAGRYDVVYYNENIKTVWVYSNRVIGTYTMASPNVVTPSFVTVGGNQYVLGSPTAKAKISTSGEFAIGDTVALLLGMDQDVVDVVAAGAVDETYVGVITKKELITYDVSPSASRAAHMLSVACTDGLIHQCMVPEDYHTVGRLVSIRYDRGELTVKGIVGTNLGGTFGANGKAFGKYRLADDVQILDVSAEGEWMTLYPSRLANATLAAGDVSYYALNDRGEISRFILNDATGDLHAYGVVTDRQESGTAAGGGVGTLTGVYQYVIDGVPGVLSSSTMHYNIQTGPAVFYYKDGKIQSMKNLTAVPLTNLSRLTATGSGKVHLLSEQVQVYIRSDRTTYTKTALSAVDADDYNLTGYRETIYPAGGQIRVIVAVKK